MVEPQQTHHVDQTGDATDSSNKRKLEESIEIAKQKFQQIASRLLNDAAAAATTATAADSKRPRFVSDVVSEPSLSTSAPLPSFPVPVAAPPSQSYGLQGPSRKISIPNGKVGVVIGKGGETIKYIQIQSGARIQITRDQDADLHSLTRDVELMGTLEQMNRAEQLINDVIAEADAGGSASSVGHGPTTKQYGEEQFSMKVPNDKVGLVIGKGGETIKYMQNKSGARVQIIPLHLPPGDPSTERTVYINGSTEQIEAAKELVNDVISGKRILNPSGPNMYGQQMYTQASNWAQPGQPTMQQQSQYGYAQPGAYYANYSGQQPWDQSTISQTPQQATGCGYYGQQPQMGSAPLDPNYSYSQTPVASNTYDQANSHPSYGHNISTQAPTATYGQTSQVDGGISSQSTQPAGSYPPPAYSQPVVNPQPAGSYPPPAYSQPLANPQTYWTSSSFAGQPLAPTGYDQTGYSQTVYGGIQSGQIPPSTTQPVYGQGGYPPQPTSAPSNYGQETHPYAYAQPHVETQPQSEPPSNVLSQSSVYGAEPHDGNANAEHGSNPAVQEAVPSQS